MSPSLDDEALDWALRSYVYRTLAERGGAPSVAEAAAGLGLEIAQVRAACERLHDRHALYLDPATRAVRIANPFSAIATAFRVQADGRAYFANCAWDALGIPVALHADARIDAVLADSGESISLAVEGERVYGPPVLAHFALPFREWYRDLIFT